jgi:hypothetical protein
MANVAVPPSTARRDSPAISELEAAASPCVTPVSVRSDPDMIAPRCVGWNLYLRNSVIVELLP